MKNTEIGFGLIMKAVLILAMATAIGFSWTYCISGVWSFLIPGSGFMHNAIVCIIVVAAFGFYLARIFPVVVVGLSMALVEAETKITSLFQEAFFWKKWRVII